MYPTTFVTRVKSVMRADTSCLFATAANVIETGNLIYTDWCTRVALESQDYFLTSASVSVVAGTATYALPPRCLRVRGLLDASSLPVRELQFFEDVPLAYEGWILRGDTLYISPTPTTTETWTIYYDALPPDMMYGTATAGAAAAITLATSATAGYHADVDDYYNGATIALSSGTGAPTTRTASDYAIKTGTSNAIITVSSNWTTAPASGSVYEIPPVLPDDFMRAMIWLTAAHLLDLDGQAQQGAVLRSQGQQAALTSLVGLKGRSAWRAGRIEDLESTWRQ